MKMLPISGSTQEEADDQESALPTDASVADPGSFALAQVAAGYRCPLPPVIPPAVWWSRLVELAGRGPDMPLEAVADAAISWLVQSSHQEQTVRKYANEIGRFLASSRLRGASTLGDLTEEMVREYLDEPIYRYGLLRGCSPKTIRFRLSAIRKLFSILSGVGVLVQDPTSGVEGPALAVALTRPLTDAEMEAVRDSADRTLVDTLGPAAIALAEAGGKTGEIAAVVTGDVDLGRGTVVLGGGRTQRTNTLTPWEAESLRRRLEARSLMPEEPVLVGAATVGYSATASVSQTIKGILRLAGLGSDRRVRPESIRAWSGRSLYDQTGDLISCARWLGLESLDTTADLIGLGWRER